MGSESFQKQLLNIKTRKKEGTFCQALINRKINVMVFTHASNSSKGMFVVLHLD